MLADAQPQYSGKKNKGKDEKSPPRATILAIDDEPSFLQFYDAILGTEGYRLICANSVELAIQRLQSNSEIDLILCDLRMSERDGFDLLKFMRNNLRFAQIPVIMCTGSKMHDDVIQCLKLGARDYVAKPLTAELLLSKVEAVLASRGGKILLVSDDPYEVKLMSRALRKELYVVVPTPTYETALTLLEKERFAAVILKLEAKDLKGLEMMADIKSQWGDLPVVMIRAWDCPFDVKQLISTGVDGIIQKPFNNTEIVQLMKRTVKSVPRPTSPSLNITRVNTPAEDPPSE